MGPVAIEMRSGIGASRPALGAVRVTRPHLLPRGATPFPIEREDLAEALAERSPGETRFLENRLVPQAGLQADLIAISPSGIWVVDAKQPVGVARVIGRGVGQELWIGNHDCTDLVAGLRRQVELVGSAVEALTPGVSVSGAFCLLDAELPTFRTLMVRGIPLCGLEAMCKRLNVPGPIDEARAELLERELALRFPAC